MQDYFMKKTKNLHEGIDKPCRLSYYHNIKLA
nr:MAG TPA: hypothetical protein [Caudoviricetes sp.]